jgi:hypothetical protein
MTAATQRQLQSKSGRCGAGKLAAGAGLLLSFGLAMLSKVYLLRLNRFETGIATPSCCMIS